MIAFIAGLVKIAIALTIFWFLIKQWWTNRKSMAVREEAVTNFDPAKHAEGIRTHFLREGLRGVAGVTPWYGVKEQWADKTLIHVDCDVPGSLTPAETVRRGRALTPIVTEALEAGCNRIIAYNIVKKAVVFAFDDPKQAMLFKLAM